MFELAPNACSGFLTLPTRVRIGTGVYSLTPRLSQSALRTHVSTWSTYCKGMTVFV